MRKQAITAVVALSLGMAGCVAPGPGQPGYAPPGTIGANNTTAGTLLGAGTGALIGSQFGRGSGSVAATVIGGILGGIAGNSIGRRLDEADLAAANRSGQVAFDSGQPQQWRNPNTGNYGTITPTRSYDDGGAYCREFQQTIVVGGETQNAYGRACRQPDGSWKIVS